MVRSGPTLPHGPNDELYVNSNRCFFQRSKLKKSNSIPPPRGEPRKRDVMLHFLTTQVFEYRLNESDDHDGDDSFIKTAVQ
jgi:hypothetical protein